MAQGGSREGQPRTFYATLAADQIKWGVPPGQPLMLSVASFTAWRPRWTGMPALPSSPLDGREVAVDSGGYMAAKRGGYDYDVLAYIRWLSHVRPLWAALPDLCNEPAVAPTREAVQARVLTSFAVGIGIVWQWARDVPWAWVPTIQGYLVEDYVRSAQLQARHIAWMQAEYDAGKWTGNPAAWDGFPDPYVQAVRAAYPHVVSPTDRHRRGFRVGIGSLCVRKDAGWMERVDQIIEAVAAELPDARFHLWGISLNYLRTRAGRLHPAVLSTDSSAFNGRFGSDIQRLEREYGRTCRACLAHFKWGELPERCPMCGGSWGLGQREHALRVRLPAYSKKVNRYLNVQQERLV